VQNGDLDVEVAPEQHMAFNGQPVDLAFRRDGQYDSECHKRRIQTIGSLRGWRA